MDTQSGSCLCGDITYTLSSKVLNVVNCHCNFCRSHSGAAFSTYAALPYAALKITSGQDKLRSFEAEAGTKHFCGRCGTPLFNLNRRYPGACMVYFGTIRKKADDLDPKMNIWCESKLPWVDSIAAIRSIEQGIERRKKP